MVAELTADQRSLRELTRKFLARRADEPVVRAAMETPAGFDEGVWREFAELGLCGTAVPARYGGANCGPAEVAIVMRELGRALAPLPFFPVSLWPKPLSCRATMLPPLTGCFPIWLPAGVAPRSGWLNRRGGGIRRRFGRPQQSTTAASGAFRGLRLSWSTAPPPT